MGERVRRTRIECIHCEFTTVVEADDDRDPVAVLVAHGRETGHRLRSEPVDE